LLENGNAYMDDYKVKSDAYNEVRSPYIGRADEVVEIVAAKLGSGPEDRAIASAAAVRSDENVEWSITLLALLAVSTAALIDLAAAFAHYRILRPGRRRSSPSSN
jgi:hypothetical protein